MKRNNLIALRKRNRYSGSDLAKMAGISRQHYNRLENGESDGSLEIWQCLKTLLDAPSIDFLTEQSDYTAGTIRQ